MKRRLGWITPLIFLLLIIPSLLKLYGNFLWFENLGYQDVFLRVLTYKVALFAAATIITAAILLASYAWTLKSTKEKRNPIIITTIAFLAFLTGLVYANNWDVVLEFINRTTFSAVDPFFQNDISFYVFTIDFLHAAISLVLRPVFLALLLTAALLAKKHAWSEVEVINLENSVTQKRFDGKKLIKKLQESTQIAVLLAITLIIYAAKFFLRRYDTLYSQFGGVFGIGYVDANILIPLFTILVVACAVGGIILLFSRSKKSLKYVIGGIIGIALLGFIISAATQSFIVEPDEFNKEKPYIEHEIRMTNQAFALDRIDERQFPVADNLTIEEIEANPETINNIRLWDWRPLLKTYNELQIFRTYYTFNDVDIDRYDIDGESKEVMVSAREINIRSLPPQSQTWVNEHLVYTHGFGVTMSPVKEVSPEGLPELIIQDIPPKTHPDIPITQPRIYFGESSDSYAIVNTNTQELDYPAGDQNVYTTYEGNGIPIDSLVDRLVFATMLGAPQILFSGSITDESSILFDRDIHDRVRKIAPFLKYDDDPYIVIADGKLYWMYDAYTTTGRYPYARQTSFKGERTNYVRNAVKVVIDAYSGETTFYVADEQDPIIHTYTKIFPDLFEDMDAMPASLKSHIRYPEDIFLVQSQLYLDYHMKDAQVFYNREDSWRIPNEILRGTRTEMEPYYVIMKLPGNEEAEFVQILPFIPRGKENMIGWMAARSDEPNYGKLQAFQFSKQELIFGPMQIESRIDQDTEISQLITLWSQAGSSVLRGNLLAIPVADSILYVEPLYLQSTGEGSLPELKQVIVAQGDRLTMQPTLQEALLVLFGEAEEVQQDVPVTQDLSNLQDIYQQAQDALRDGNFELYAQKITELGEELSR